jgi:hypothetical protein
MRDKLCCPEKGVKEETDTDVIVREMVIDPVNHF